jgi:hypothetical protein
MDFGPILHVVHPSSSARLELRIDQSLRELVDRAVFDRRQVLSIQASSTDDTISGVRQGCCVDRLSTQHFRDASAATERHTFGALAFSAAVS